MDTARHITDPKIFVPYAFIDTTCKRCLSLTCEFPTLHCTKLAALVWTQEVDCCFETEVKTVTDFAIVTVNDQTQGCKETPYCKLQFSQCNETKVGGILWSLRVRKKDHFLPFLAALTAHIIPVIQGLQESCHTQSFAPTPLSGKAAKQEQQLCECTHQK